MNTLTLKLPSKRLYWEVAKSTLEAIYRITDFPKKEAHNLTEAVRELFENAVTHAYKDEEGIVEIEIELLQNAIFVSVKDKGEPFDERLFRAVPIDLEQKGKGFNRIYKLVDDFRYANLGLEGKKFTVGKYLPISLVEGAHSDIALIEEEPLKEELKSKILIRTFEPGDEVWIPKLIYKNYGYTYFKEDFYFPQKILQKEQEGKILSIVAQYGEKIIGHFAMVRLPKSNIAEIGVAVVDPKFKGLGIMKEMFHLLLKKAKEMGLSALFGEAITFHPYSQRANARFGFCTTALMLGDVHQMVRLKNHSYPFKNRRGAVALEYKILKPFTKRIAIPKRYAKWVETTYAICHVHHIPRSRAPLAKDKITYEINPLFKIAYVIIDDVSANFEFAFKKVFESVIAKHPDMIYADLNLEEISDIDHAVEVLREFGFFYCGIAFLRRFEKDYLRLQFEVSENIETKEIRCYSNLCKKLHRFILDDMRK